MGKGHVGELVNEKNGQRAAGYVVVVVMRVLLKSVCPARMHAGDKYPPKQLP